MPTIQSINDVDFVLGVIFFESGALKGRNLKTKRNVFKRFLACSQWFSACAVRLSAW